MSKWLRAELLLLFVLSMTTAAASAAPLKAGDKAPDFALPDQNDASVRLRNYVGKRKVVLIFFGQVYSEQSTNQLRPYQKLLPQFEQADTQVIGITVENDFAIEAFAMDLHISFPVLSDYGIHFDKEVSQKYGVLKQFARFADPLTFVIDKDGIIRHVEENASPDRILHICGGL